MYISTTTKKKIIKKDSLHTCPYLRPFRSLSMFISGPPETRNKPMTYEVFFFYSKQKSRAYHLTRLKNVEQISMYLFSINYSEREHVLIV